MFQVLIHLSVISVVIFLSILLYYLQFGQGWGNPYSNSLATECYGGSWLYLIIVLVVILLLLIVLTVVMLWKVYDPYFLKLELKLLLLFGVICFPLWLVALWDLVPFKPEYVLYGLYYALFGISIAFPLVMSYRMKPAVVYLRRSSSSQSMDQQAFAEVMSDPNLLKSFEKYISFLLSFFCFTFLLILSRKASFNLKLP